MDKDEGWAISDALMEKVFELVPIGGTILELGAGYSTYAFDKSGYSVISIEHDPEFLNKVPTATYIHAPIELYNLDAYRQLPSMMKRLPNVHTGWYNRKAVAQGLRKRTYDCIIVDGPPRNYGRSGFIVNLELFKCDGIPIFFDDLHRLDDLFVAECVAQHLSRDLLITNNYPGGKPFGILLV